MFGPIVAAFLGGFYSIVLGVLIYAEYSSKKEHKAVPAKMKEVNHEHDASDAPKHRGHRSQVSRRSSSKRRGHHTRNTVHSGRRLQVQV